MKCSDKVKEKAMVKLKEVKSKTDDSSSKSRQYLDGLLPDGRKGSWRGSGKRELESARAAHGRRRTRGSGKRNRGGKRGRASRPRATRHLEGDATIPSPGLSARPPPNYLKGGATRCRSGLGNIRNPKGTPHRPRRRPTSTRSRRRRRLSRSCRGARPLRYLASTASARRLPKERRRGRRRRTRRPGPSRTRFQGTRAGRPIYHLE